MANKQVILNLNGELIGILNEGISVEEHLVNGARVVIVPETFLNRSSWDTQFNTDFEGEGLIKPDPRSELKLQMQKSNLGTGCTAGITTGITGCGYYSWNETVYQNISLLDERHRSDATIPVYDDTIRKFGKSSVHFRGLDSGTTGGVLLLHDIPGLTLAGPGGHIGGGSGASGGGVSGGYSGDALLQMYFYITATPTSDEILAMHGNSAAGGTGNSWKLYYDHSSTSLKFDFNNMGDSPTAWAHSMTVTAGVPVVDKWHHVAIIYKSRWYASNVSEVIPYYDNTRNETGISSGVINELLRTDQPLSIGAGQSGAFAFNGFIDDFHFQMGPSGGTVCRGFSGATYVTAGIQATMDNYSTLALCRFNGPSGCYRFAVDNYNRVSAKVTYWNASLKTLGIRDIKLTGNATAGFDYAYGYVEGFEGTAHHQISCTGGTFMSGDEKREMKKGQFRQAESEYLGLAGISGNSGESGDLKHLYGLHGSVGHGEPKFIGNDVNGFSVRVNKNTMLEVNEMVNYIQCIGGTAATGGNFIFKDTLGNDVGLSSGHITALYQDMFVFRNNLRENTIAAQTEVDSGSTHDTQSYSQLSDIELTASGIADGNIPGFDPEGSSKYTDATTKYSASQSYEQQSPGK